MLNICRNLSLLFRADRIACKYSRQKEHGMMNIHAGKQINNDDQTADFISCVAFGRSAEFAEKYLHQGTKIAVTGRIQTGSYTNRDGQKVYTTDVIVEDQEFAESKAASQQSSGGSYQAPARQTERPAAPLDDGFINIPDGVEDDGLPFN